MSGSVQLFSLISAPSLIQRIVTMSGHGRLTNGLSTRKTLPELVHSVLQEGPRNQTQVISISEKMFYSLSCHAFSGVTIFRNQGELNFLEIAVGSSRHRNTFSIR